MKMKYWSILAVTLSAGFVAQFGWADDQPGPVPPSPNASPSTLPAPERSAKKKKSAEPKKSTAAPKKTMPAAEPAKPAALVPGPAVVSEKNQGLVNVRGKPDINSEVVTRLKRGDQVTVLEAVTVKAKEDAPAKWAKISLPTNAVAWVNASFINPADKTVAPKKLNVRSGPGENYSVVARIPKGTVVKEIETKGDWIKIEAPSDSYGFVAAHLLANPPPAPVVVASVEPPKPPLAETTIAPPTAVPPPVAPLVVTPVPTPPPPVVAQPVPAPVTPTTTPVVATPPTDTVPVPTPAVATTPAVPAAPTAPAEEIFVKRIVSREGVVKRSVSIQAPTYFALQSLDTGKTINYLYSPSTNLLLKDLTGKRILVTGEELLDERWPNTPVINVDTLQPVP